MGSPVVRALTHCRGDRFPLIRAAHVAEQGCHSNNNNKCIIKKNVYILITFAFPVFIIVAHWVACFCVGCYSLCIQ